MMRNRDAQIGSYVREHTTHKLHLGCGGNVLPGWLNTDHFPWFDTDGKVVQLDVTLPFPFSADCFDYVFSEHLIEHLPSYSHGVQMLRESHRVLRPGGRVRVSTPDFRFLLDLCAAEPSQIQADYIKWAVERVVPDAPYVSPLFVVNNFMRAWGHQFIYGEPELRRALESAGFVDVTRHELNRSGDPELAGLENETRLPKGFLALETMTLEGVKQ